MKIRRLSSLVLAGALASAVVPAIVGAPAHAATKPAKGKQLVLGMLDGPKTHAAVDVELGNRALFFQAVYDSLLHSEPDGTLTPWLATKWSYNADLTVLTLTTRTGVKFTDGTPFNAAAAARDLMHYKDGKGIGATLFSSMTAAKATGPNTLEITLSAPDPGFLTYLAGPLMESPKALDTPGEKTNPVGSGPYILDTKKTVEGTVYEYTANPNYWNKSAQKFSGITMKVIKDGTAMVNAMKSGEIDGGNIAAADAVGGLKAAGLTILEQDLDWVGLSLVDRDGALGSPLKDVRVRQAINHAIDRAAILHGFANDRGQLTQQVFRKGSGMYDPALDNRYPYDVAKAKQLLADAGYKDGFEINFPKVTGVIGDAIWILLEDQLGKVGIKVKFTEVAIGDFFGQILAPKYPAFFMFLERNPNDWVAINFLTSKTAIWNPAHFGDATSDDLYNKIQRANDKDRPALEKQYGKYIADQAWFAPMYNNVASFAVNPKKLKAVVQNGNAIPLLTNYSPA